MGVAVRFGLVAVVALSTGCGGGAPSQPGAAPPLANLPLFAPALATTPQTITVIGIGAGNGQVTRQTAVLTGTTIAGSQLAGTVDLPNSRIVLNAGGAGQVTTGNGGDQQFFFDTGSTFGVAGLPAASIPGSGLANFSGTMSVFVDDGSMPELLGGTVSVSADFGNNLVDVTANSLSSANRAGTLGIAGASITGTGISGGALSLTGNFANLPNGSTVSHAGQFFGSGGSEVGGAFHFDETSTGNALKIRGSYSAK